MAWTKYKEVKYAADGIPPANLTDFPVPVWIDGDTDIASELSGGGGIKFTNAAGNVDLAFGLYPDTDLASGDVHARVKLSPLTAASVGDVIARIYYSSGESTTEDKAGTVSNGYELFMPMEEDPSGSAPQMFDWVSESNIGTAHNMESGDLITLQVGSGLRIETSERVIVPGATEAVDCTYEVITTVLSAGSTAWPRDVVWTTENGGGVGGANDRNLGFVAARPIFRIFDGAEKVATGATTITTDVRYSLAGTADGSNAKLYLNGQLDGSIAAGDPFTGYTTPTTEIGPRTGATVEVDEVRASSVARDADWLAYAYATDFNLADLWTLSAEQGGGGGTIYTRLSLMATPGQRYGLFSGKSAAGGNRRRRALICGRA